jgi:hypothetical protein
MARPLLEIDEETVEKLAGIHCTMEEIAYVVGCSVDTLERRFAETIKAGKAKGRTSLRRHQWLSAEKGNVTMLIWLGKQLLGQTDKLVHAEDNKILNSPDISPLSPEERTLILEKLKNE